MEKLNQDMQHSIEIKIENLLKAIAITELIEELELAK